MQTIFMRIMRRVRGGRGRSWRRTRMLLQRTNMSRWLLLDDWVEHSISNEMYQVSPIKLLFNLHLYWDLVSELNVAYHYDYVAPSVGPHDIYILRLFTLSPLSNSPIHTRIHNTTMPSLKDFLSAHRPGEGDLRKKACQLNGNSCTQAPILSED